jgi:beta-glucosidase
MQMKKFLKISLIFVVVLLVAAAAGAYYFYSNFLNFEQEYTVEGQPQELMVADYTFLDRNSNGELDAYEDDRRPLKERVENLLTLMTTAEKIHLLKGSGLASALGMGDGGIPGAAGTIVATPRLGLPLLYLSDGPAGLRIESMRKDDDKKYYATAFPIGTLLASTWNTSLVELVGEAMGNEALEYGVDVILGPGVNIHRNPLCGRNFEYYSEDPILTGRIGAAMVNGIETNGVGTSVKHFVANNQETDRFINDSRLSERALREIYLKPYEIIVKSAQPWTIMSSYNKLNGTYVSESRYLLNDVLREDWGYKGVVMSDWFGGNDAVAQVSAGNDLLEPGTKRQWEALIKGEASGALSMATIDTSAKRILELILQSRKMQSSTYSNNPDLEQHAAIARQSAAEGMVLLKNDDVLPLQQIRRVALLGNGSFDFISGGTGSGDVNEAYTVSLEDGLNNKGFTLNKTAKSVYAAHKSDNSEAFVKPEGMEAMFEPYDPPAITYSDSLLEAFAEHSDAAIITIQRNSGEGGDRKEQDDFLLRANELDLITDACRLFHAVNKKVVVVLNIGGVIETASWKDLPDAILLTWLGGQEGGNATADLLTGRVNPSGKLPMTFPVNLSDHASAANFPLGGETMNMTDLIFGSRETKPEEDQVKNVDYTLYEEGIYVGYRHFDKQKIEVSYPFGFGLSYTRFEYGDLGITVSGDTVRISLTVINTGDQPGKEVVQIYSSVANTGIERPNQELKAFAKTPLLAKGARVELSFSIPFSELTYWDEDASQWALEAGSYAFSAGSSSRDIRSIESIEITKLGNK